MCDPAPSPAVRRALDTLRCAAFTGRLVVTWVGAVCVRVHWEGVGEGWGVAPNWCHAHTTALKAIRAYSPDMGTGCVVVQLSKGVPVGTHLDTL